MSQVLGTNLLSLSSQRHLSHSGTALATTVQRLSSGLRINSAKDDAAGLAIAERFTAQLRGQDQALRNANDGISLAQTAEGALVEVGNNLQRIRELAVQSANATQSTADRAALQAEVDQLLQEIDRVAAQTHFNGQPLLDVQFSALFQIGADAGQTLSIPALLDTRPQILGKTDFPTCVLGLQRIDPTGTVNGPSGHDPVPPASFTINGHVVQVPEMPGQSIGSYPNANDAMIGGRVAYARLLASCINAEAGQTQVIAEPDPNDGTVRLIRIMGQGRISATNTVAGSHDVLEKVTGQVDIGTFAGAQMAMCLMDSALAEVNLARADLGALQNRFSSVIASLQNSHENLSASRSRIQDADYARETAQLTRSQILQQAGSAMLSQANTLPSNVLTLIQG